MAPGTTLTAFKVFSARRSKFWLVMYSSACQRVHRLTRLPTLALPAMAPTRGSLKCGTRCEMASGAMMVSASMPTKISSVTCSRPKLSAAALPEFGLVSTVTRPAAISLRKRVTRDFERRVLRAVVDHDDAQVRVVRVQHGADRALDDLLFVVGGNQHGDARADSSDRDRLAAAEAIVDCQQRRRAPGARSSARRRRRTRR